MFFFQKTAVIFLFSFVNKCDYFMVYKNSDYSLNRYTICRFGLSRTLTSARRMVLYGRKEHETFFKHGLRHSPSNIFIFIFTHNNINKQ